ncbi:Rrf2 family transcriptional regulator [Paenibacillus athensensis]|uniref:Transcriptional regulator n=1 Tax=Paenibacillus athensensis TaxID=1967502 RepID=A0A4Y8Q0B0_9BACL|nr:Rrf2 family transcriptional regulator [Paenibacillus athensensis]MCD1261146.1 Rrf2 family transcriptional regulator [Paenibacillus athensensis]
MKYSKATNYALHAMMHLMASASSKPVGVQQLAKTLHVSPTYLSKILTSLVKARIIESASGVNGGYRLLATREDVSFFDIIQAIEGSGSLFDCNLGHPPDTCLIQRVMTEAEQAMEQMLKQKKLIDLCAEFSSVPM